MDFSRIRHHKMTKHLLPFVTALLITFGLITIMQAYMPAIEGRFAPVAKAVKVSIKRDGTQAVIIVGEMDKHRACTFEEISAYLVNNVTGTRVIVPINFQETIKLFPPGDHPWGPWKLNTPLWRTELRSLEIITLHDCHPFWPTRTVFWRSG